MHAWNVVGDLIGEYHMIHLHTVSDQKLDSGKACMGSLVFMRCSRYYIASFKAPWNCRKVTSHLFSMKNRHYSFKHYHSVMIMNLASFPGLLVPPVSSNAKKAGKISLCSMTLGRQRVNTCRAVIANFALISPKHAEWWTVLTFPCK